MDARSVTGSPAGARSKDANASFKERCRAWFWAGITAAVAVHLAVLALGPPFTIVRDVTAPPGELYALELVPPPEAAEPEPPVARPEPPEPAIPERPARPAQPVPVDLEGDLAYEPFSFQDVAMLPPPPLEVDEKDDPADVVFTVAPELTNRERIRSILLRRYPSRLRNAGVEGTVLLQLWIDEQGEVTRHEMARSSGNADLDRIAEEVIELMEFSPAFNLGKPVAVSVALPIVFEVR